VTCAGDPSSHHQVAHAALAVGSVDGRVDRGTREGAETTGLAPGATRAFGAGHRLRFEKPDPLRTCFERDLDRIQHSRPFRRLAGKCQVYLAPDDDHLRTRLTHAIEVAQVAVAVSRAVGLNVALTAAAATGHDCGHGPAGHASEEALTPYVDGGYHHAVYGADIVLEPLNLCEETLDAIRNHSWNRPAPITPEGEVVAWADRMAYVCHDFEDAVSAGVVGPRDLPDAVTDVLGDRRSVQLDRLIGALVEAIVTTGTVALHRREADALEAFRAFNYEHIYLRPDAVDQADRVIGLLRSLTEFFIDAPSGTAPGPPPVAGTDEAVAAAVRYVSGMTDRFALRLAVEELGWKPDALPRGV
jgi:dGTPase